MFNMWRDITWNAKCHVQYNMLAGLIIDLETDDWRVFESRKVRSRFI